MQRAIRSFCAFRCIDKYSDSFSLHWRRKLMLPLKRTAGSPRPCNAKSNRSIRRQALQRILHKVCKESSYPTASRPNKCVLRTAQTNVDMRDFKGDKTYPHHRASTYNIVFVGLVDQTACCAFSSISSNAVFGWHSLRIAKTAVDGRSSWI